MKKLLIRLGFPFLKLYWFLFRPKTHGVKCAVINEGNIVLVRHSYGSQLWALPGGGVKKGESIEETVKREMREELGLLVHSVEEKAIYINKAEYKIDTVHCCESYTSEKKLIIDEVEIIEAKWFHLSELPQEMSPLSAHVLGIIQKKLS